MIWRNHDISVPVLQVERGHGEGLVHGDGALHPEARAVEVDQQPLGRVEGERGGALDAREKTAELRANDGTARVRRVHMEPHTFVINEKLAIYNHTELI